MIMSYPPVMARPLATNPITAKDLDDFATRNSDFGFEMQVLKRLREQGFSCDHSGTYRDPVTDKIRQFDIRAFLARGDSALWLAVECKNLRPYSPLLLSAVPRNQTEAFHDLILRREHHTYTQFQVMPCTENGSAYKVGGMVGKRTDQVGRNSSGELTSNDEATYEKLNQAVNSCQQLVTLASSGSPLLRRVVVPVLVVPTGLLWQVDYNADGAITAPPHIVNRVPYFLNHAWSTNSIYGEALIYRLSHVEVVTFDELAGIADSWSGPGGFFPR
jgi:hypothetical protein